MDCLICCKINKAKYLSGAYWASSYYYKRERTVRLVLNRPSVSVLFYHFREAYLLTNILSNSYCTSFIVAGGCVVALK